MLAGCVQHGRADGKGSSEQRGSAFVDGQRFFQCRRARR
jgi:hypothetical protein